MFLIIGGTAAYHLDLTTIFGRLEQLVCDTPYGQAFPIFRVVESAIPLAFASRHGVHHLDVTPPFVNARANIWAASTLGVQAIFSWNGVGAINPMLELHDVVVPDTLLDFTKTRLRSFAEEPSSDSEPFPFPLMPQHPFDPTLANRLFHAARATTTRAFAVGTYICTEGPRLETAAEIQAFKHMQADIVGMTLVPEVLLARERGIAYASLAYVTNYATGVEPGYDDVAGAPRVAPRHFGADVAIRCLEIIRTALSNM
jgi:5'-methylthioadenosine phosphorylase